MLASLLWIAGMPSRGTPGVYPALMFVTDSGMRGSRPPVALPGTWPKMLTMSENRSSSVSCSSTSRARSSTAAVAACVSAWEVIASSSRVPCTASDRNEMATAITGAVARRRSGTELLSSTATLLLSACRWAPCSLLRPRRPGDESRARDPQLWLRDEAPVMYPQDGAIAAV